MSHRVNLTLSGAFANSPRRTGSTGPANDAPKPCKADKHRRIEVLEVTTSSVSRRYAKALLSVGEEDGRWDAYAAEIDRVSAAFQASPELRELWLNPANPRETRLAAVDALAKSWTLSTPVANLVRLVVERNRADDLEAIASSYRDLVDDRAGRARAIVTSATPLGAEVTQRVGATLAEITGRKIVLETKIDPTLLGGLTTQVGSTLFDGSLRTQLERLRTQLSEAPLNA